MTESQINRKHGNRPINSAEIKSGILNLPTNKRPGPDDFAGEFHIQREVNIYISETVSKFAEEGKLPNSFCQTAITLIPKPDKTTQQKEENNMLVSDSDKYRYKNPHQILKN